MFRILSTSVLASAILASVGFAAEPAVKRETIEWCNIWVAEAARTDLPRVLLVGDSICNGYHNEVARQLQGKAHVAMLATSAGIEDPALAAAIKLLLKNYKFAVVHFNNGLHAFDYTEEEYRRDFPHVLKVIQKSAPGAKLIWATSTPIRRTAPNLNELRADNERVKARNKIVVELAAAAGIPVDDLYGVVEKHPEYFADDGIHYKPEGRAAQAKQVAKMVLDALAK
jgi:hypothetical protein